VVVGKTQRFNLYRFASFQADHCAIFLCMAYWWRTGQRSAIADCRLPCPVKRATIDSSERGLCAVLATAVGRQGEFDDDDHRI
jgi:hypothetical protein